MKPVKCAEKPQQHIQYLDCIYGLHQGSCHHTTSTAAHKWLCILQEGFQWVVLTTSRRYCASNHHSRMKRFFCGLQMQASTCREPDIQLLLQQAGGVHSNYHIEFGSWQRGAVTQRVLARKLSLSFVSGSPPPQTSICRERKQNPCKTVDRYGRFVR